MFEANALTMLPQELLTRIFSELARTASCAELANDRRVCKTFDKIILPILFRHVYVTEFEDRSRLKEKLSALGKDIEVRWSVRNGALDIVSHHALAPPAAMVSAWCKFAQSLRMLDERLRDELLVNLNNKRQIFESASIVYLNERVEVDKSRPIKPPWHHRRMQSLQRRFSLQLPTEQSRHPKLFRQIHISNSSSNSTGPSNAHQFEHFGFLFAFPGQDTAEGVSINVVSPLPHGTKNAKGISVPIAQRKNLRFLSSSIQASGLDNLLKSYPDLQKLTIYACGVSTGNEASSLNDSTFSLRFLGDLLRRYRPPLRTLSVEIGASIIPCQPSAFPLGSVVFLRNLIFLNITEWSVFGLPNPMYRQADGDEDSRPYADYHWVQLTAILPSTLQRLYVMEDENAPAEQSLSYMANSNGQCLNLILSPKFGSLKFVKLDRRCRLWKIEKLLTARKRETGVERVHGEFEDEPRDLCYVRPGYSATQEEMDFANRVEREQEMEYVELLQRYQGEVKAGHKYAASVRQAQK